MPDVNELADLYAYPDSALPWVRTNFVSSLDGAVQDARGVSGDLGGEPDLNVFRVLRSLCDVVLVGAGTVRAEGYKPIQADSIHAELREGREQLPLLAVVSRSLDIPDVLLAPGTMVITVQSSPAEARQRLADRVDVVVAGDTEVDWPAVLDSFAARGLKRILCEGGPELHGALVEHDLVDEACVTISPHLVGGPAKRMTEGASAVERPMRLGHVLEEDDVLLARWVRVRRQA
ncbi:pyrimidine reductase family protein [Aeromicrobium sp.]|uniref:pyrimidine reductase family protein n=1 Tax=Aeromicrobium sp. TaxID=1871063 RepID=UPI0028AF3DFA|nr:pyrimidine reductase family protein [Aeromicrobium sp.]